jgi:hypothetical protein
LGHIQTSVKQKPRRIGRGFLRSRAARSGCRYSLRFRRHQPSSPTTALPADAGFRSQARVKSHCASAPLATALRVRATASPSSARASRITHAYVNPTSASHSTSASACGTSGVSSDAGTTLSPAHTRSACFAHLNDDPVRLLEGYRWHCLRRRRQGQCEGNSD